MKWQVIATLNATDFYYLSIIFQHTPQTDAFNPPWHELKIPSPQKLGSCIYNHSHIAMSTCQYCEIGNVPSIALGSPNISPSSSDWGVKWCNHIWLLGQQPDFCCNRIFWTHTTMTLTTAICIYSMKFQFSGSHSEDHCQNFYTFTLYFITMLSRGTYALAGNPVSHVCW